MMYIKFLTDKNIWVVVNENGTILCYQSSFIAAQNWVKANK